MNCEQNLADLKQRISALWQTREQLKSALATADASTRRRLWQQLEETDAQLSDLDSRFKQLWDAGNS